MDTVRARETSGTAASLAAAGAARSGEGAPPGRLLPGHEPLTSNTVHGWTAVVFGVPFLGAGVFVALAALDVIRAADASFHAPREVVAGIGGAFALIGVALLVHGGAGVARARRTVEDRRRFPDSPWRHDRAWHRDGEDAAHLGGIARALAGTLAFAAFGGVGVWLAFAKGGAPLVAKIAACGFAAITLLPAIELARRVLHALRYGRTYVRWGRFPSFTGERLTVRFGVTRAEPRFTRLVARLRCVEARYEDHGTSSEPSVRVACYALHEQEEVVESGGLMPQPGTDATFHFDVPAALPGNDLLARPGRWWEIEVTGEAPGLDYRHRFLLPVYAQPSRT